MKQLLLLVGWLFGLRFADDNYVVPVMRMGRFHHVGGPGFFWVIPFYEKTLPQVKQSLYVVNLNLKEVLSKDGIPFGMNLTVLFSFDPAEAFIGAASVLVRAEAGLLETIVKDYTNQGVRRLAARLEAEQLWGTDLLFIERDLTKFLTAQLSALGLKPLRSGGILVKEVYLPDRVKRIIEKIRHLRSALQTVSIYPAPALIEQVVRLILINGIEDTDQMTLLMSANNQLESANLPYVFDLQRQLHDQHRQ